MSKSRFGFLSITRGLMLAVMLAPLTLAPPAAAAHAAQVFEVTRLDDPVPDGCQTGDCSLREAIDAANAHANAISGPDEVSVPDGTIELSRQGAGDDTNATGDLDITESVRITGAGTADTILDGLGSDRIIDAESSTDQIDLDIVALTLRNGYASSATGGDGGAIRNLAGGATDLTSVALEDNASDDDGGAIYAEAFDTVTPDATATITLTTSQVTGNANDADGGAVYCWYCSSLTLADSTFTDNVGDSGAVFYCSACDSAPVSISGSTFTDNIAMDYGGVGYCSDCDDVTITNSTFRRNWADDDYGGVLYCSSCGELDVSGSTFAANEAQYEGGVFYCSSCDGVTLDTSTFTRNVAYDDEGGVLYCSSCNGDLTITDSQFTDNTAGYDGGVVYCSSCHDATISDSTFTGNTAQDDSGGALDCTSCDDLTITSSTFTDNTAAYEGGAIHCSSCDNVRIDASMFDGNRAMESDGGAIDCSSCSLSGDSVPSLWVTDSTFTDNIAGDDDGGAIDCNSCSGVLIEDTTFARNQAQNEYEGGAVACSSCSDDASLAVDLSIADSTFVDNEAGGEGGAIECSSCSGVSEITNTTFTGNRTIYGDGGAVYCSSCDDLTMTDVTVSENRSMEDGGGISISSGSVAIVDSAITENWSLEEGAGVYASTGSTVTISGSDVSGNETGNDGGGIYRSGGVLEVTDSTIDGNLAGLDGGGIALENGATLDIDDSSITANEATLGGAVALRYEDTADLTNVTLSGNEAAVGGGVHNVSGRLAASFVTVANNDAYDGGGAFFTDLDDPDTGDGFVPAFETTHVLVAGNSVPQCDGDEPDDTQGYNLEAATTSCGFTVNAQNPAEAGIMALTTAPNGTMVHPLASSSAAVDTGEAGPCTAVDASPVTDDQRGVSRPQGAACDIGAVERESGDDDGATVAGESITPIEADASASQQDDVTAQAVAQTFTVTRTDDPEPDGCTVSDCSLREAVDAANDNPNDPAEPDAIELSAGTYELSRRGAAEDGNDTGDLDVTAPLTLRGTAGDASGVIIDGLRADRIIDADQAANQAFDISVENLTLTRGFANDSTGYEGGAIYVEDAGNVSLTDVELLDNGSDDDGGALYLDYFTGETASVALTRVLARNNAADDEGAVFRCEDCKGIRIVDSTFTDNIASYSGGVFYCTSCETSPVVIDGSTLERNVGGYAGVGHCTSCGEVTISNSTLTDNRADDDYGGVLYCTSCGGVALTSSVFDGNQAQYYGGVLYCTSCRGNVTMTTSTFTDNIAWDEYGGVLYWSGGDGRLTVTDSTFTGNEAGYDGGAIRCGTCERDVTITNSTFTDNYAYDDSGGAIDCASCNDYTTVTGSTFTNNTSGYDGGAIHCSTCEGIRVADSTFAGNRSFESDGGAIDCSSCSPYEGTPALWVSDSTFSDNVAGDDDGGAIDCNSCNRAVVIERSAFTANRVHNDYSGGALACNSCSDGLTVTDSTFTGNFAGEDGGALSCTSCDDHTTLTNLTFTDNTSLDGDGGAIHCSTCYQLNLRDSTFSGNRSYEDGGSMYLGSTSTGAKIVETSFTNSYALDNGGAIYDSSGNPTTLGSVAVTDSVAQQRGGAIYRSSGSSMLVEGSLLDGNRASSGGAVDVLSSATVRLEETSLTNNTATFGGGLAQASTSDVTAVNTTISTNTAQAGGGVFNDNGFFEGSYDTLAFNSASEEGGAIAANHSASGGTTVHHMLLAENGTDPCAGPVTSFGFNLESPTDDCGLAELSDQAGVADAGLQPLTDVTELARVHLLEASSPAVDTGEPACDEINGDPVRFDQRERVRPNGAVCDIGAVEYYVRSTGGGGGGGGGGGAAPPEQCTIASGGSCDVGEGGTVSTGDGPATETDPLVTSVTTPAAGTVTITQTFGSPGEDPPGMQLLDFFVDIDAPAGTPENPLELRFRLDESLLPEGVRPQDIVILRNGVAVPRCADSSADVADPDPCMLPLTTAGDDIVLTVLTSEASRWTFAVPLVAACPTGEVPQAAFQDVGDNIHASSIDCVVWWEIARGLSQTRYGPAVDVTRAQMASFIAQMVDATGAELPAGDDAFSDDDGDTHEANINRLAAAGLVRGTAADTYDPAADVSRAQMATFLVGAYEYVSGETLSATADYFDDDEQSVHEANINMAREAGLTRGISERSYAPTQSVRRDQMASFIVNTLSKLVQGGHVAPRS